MRRTLGATVAATVLAGGFVLGAAGGPVASGAALLSHQDGETLVLVGRPVNEIDVDLGRHGFGPGDLLVFRDRVFDEAGAAQVGRLNGQCTVGFPTSRRRATLNCHGSLTLDDQGQLLFQGVVTFTEETTTFKLGIVGGTDHFLDVRGDVDVEFVSDEEERFTLNLMA